MLVLFPLTPNNGISLLQIMKGIQAYIEPRPALVFITSAGVERNAIIGDDEAARKKDIPIVQLNPGGTLNHKYAGEWAVRSAELPYTVIRSTGGDLVQCPALHCTLARCGLHDAGHKEMGCQLPVTGS